MPLKLISPERKEFVLERCDADSPPEDGPTLVIVRQAAQGEKEARDQLWSQWRRQYDPETGGEVIIQRFSYEVLKREEVYLTLADCNILDERDRPLFRFKNDRLDMNRTQFKDAWDKLPPQIADEIHEKVLAVNLIWTGRNLEGEESSGES